MNYETFESSFIKENRKLKALMAAGLFLSGITTTLILSSRNYFINTGGEIFKERPLMEDICKEGILSMARGEPNKLIFTSEVIQMLEVEPFTFDVDEFLRVKSLESGTCKVILKSEGKLIGFQLGLVEDAKFPFYYKIIQVDEEKLTEDDV